MIRTHQDTDSEEKWATQTQRWSRSSRTSALLVPPLTNSASSHLCFYHIVHFTWSLCSDTFVFRCPGQGKACSVMGECLCLTLAPSQEMDRISGGHKGRRWQRTQVEVNICFTLSFFARLDFDSTQGILGRTCQGGTGRERQETGVCWLGHISGDQEEMETAATASFSHHRTCRVRVSPVSRLVGLVRSG